MKTFHCLTLALLMLPPLVIFAYFSVSFPNPPESLHIYSGLSALPINCHPRKIYSEDFYGNNTGQYVMLPFGKVRYWLLGPAGGPKVTLIHGLSIPSIIYKDVAPQLVARGFRVLLYDLYGRGYSDAPQITYEPSLFSTQLALLLQYLRWDKTDIVGVSMGGGVAAVFVTSFPHLVSSHVVLIASAGIIDSSSLSRTTKFMSSPIVQHLGGWAIRKYMQRLTSAAAVNYSNDVQDPLAEIVRLQSALLPHFNAAVASSLRSGPVRGLERHFSHEEWERNGNKADEPKNVLFIHGTHDTTVPFRYASSMKDLLPPRCREKAQILSLNYAGHGLLTSHAEKVGKSIIAFLQDKGLP